jgi:hypothetical protein
MDQEDEEVEEEVASFDGTSNQATYRPGTALGVCAGRLGMQEATKELELMCRCPYARVDGYTAPRQHQARPARFWLCQAYRYPDAGDTKGD